MTTINLLNCNLGIRRLWHEVECDLEACRLAPKDVAQPWKNSWREFNFTDSQKITQLSQDEYLGLVAKECEWGRDFLLRAKNRQNQEQSLNRERRIVLGGDHMVSLVSILADLQEFKTEEVGVLMFDSHDDFDLSKESATGNFHGMWVRPLFTKFDDKRIDSLVPQKLALDQIMYVGNLDMEETVARFFKKQGMQVISGADWQTDFEKSRQKVQSFIDRFAHLHLTFDLDVVAGKADKKVATSGDWAVNLPYEGGLPLVLVEKIWSSLNLPKQMNLDVVEYNDARTSKCQETLKLARKVLKSVLELDKERNT